MQLVLRLLISALRKLPWSEGLSIPVMHTCWNCPKISPPTKFCFLAYEPFSEAPHYTFAFQADDGDMWMLLPAVITTPMFKEALFCLCLRISKWYHSAAVWTPHCWFIQCSKKVSQGGVRGNTTVVLTLQKLLWENTQDYLYSMSSPGMEKYWKPLQLWLLWLWFWEANSHWWNCIVLRTQDN